MPIHDGHKVQEASTHRNVGDVCAPDLVRAVNHRVAQQIGPNLVLWVLLAGVGLLIDGYQPHEAHQPPDTMTAAFMALPLHVTGHLA